MCIHDFAMLLLVSRGENQCPVCPNHCNGKKKTLLSASDLLRLGRVCALGLVSQEEMKETLLQNKRRFLDCDSH